MASHPLFERVLKGKSLTAADGPLFEGRLDLRHQEAASGATSAHGPRTERVATVELKRVKWKRLDLSQGRLRSFRFFDAQLDDCRFERADCSDWRLWGTEVLRCSFAGAKLKGAVLAPVDGDKRNRYLEVDFTGADLRGSVHVSADFERCNFSGAVLDNVDFQGAVFKRCTFAGELSDVLFYRHAFRGERFPPNEMSEVDFRGARLHFVGFRGLDLQSVQWPAGNDHILVRDYARTLERMMEALRARTSDGAKQLMGLLADARRWAGPNQTAGVINKDDVRELGDPDLVPLLEEVAHAAPQ